MYILVFISFNAYDLMLKDPVPLSSWLRPCAAMPNYITQDSFNAGFAAGFNGAFNGSFPNPNLPAFGATAMPGNFGGFNGMGCPTLGQAAMNGWGGHFGGPGAPNYGYNGYGNGYPPYGRPAEVGRGW